MIVSRGFASSLESAHSSPVERGSHAVQASIREAHPTPRAQGRYQQIAGKSLGRARRGDESRSQSQLRDAVGVKACAIIPEDLCPGLVADSFKGNELVDGLREQAIGVRVIG